MQEMWRGDSLKEYECPKCGDTYEVEKGRDGYCGKKRNGCFSCFPKDTRNWVKHGLDTDGATIYGVAYARQMENWIDFAWSHCMDDEYYVDIKRHSKMSGPGMYSPKNITNKRQRKGGKSATSINIGRMYQHWRSAVRKWQTAKDPMLGDTEAGRFTYCYVTESEAFHEFQLFYDFMSDNFQYPPNFPLARMVVIETVKNQQAKRKSQ
jgi:hypothetical protein